MFGFRNLIEGGCDGYSSGICRINLKIAPLYSPELMNKTPLHALIVYQRVISNIYNKAYYVNQLAMEASTSRLDKAFEGA